MMRGGFAWAVVIWLVLICVTLFAAGGEASDQDDREQAADAVASTLHAAEQEAHADDAADMMSELPVPPPKKQPAAQQQEEQAQHLYTEADAVALAKMAWGECRGVGTLTINGKAITGTCQKAATMWCVLNRYDAGFEDSIAEVVAAPMQFVGYGAGNPVTPELLDLAYDVLERWEQERLHGGDVGRVLPADYMWFLGDGRHNWFANEWRSRDYYTWTLPDPYAGE